MRFFACIFRLMSVRQNKRCMRSCLLQTMRRERRTMNVIELRRLILKAKEYDPDAFVTLMQYFSKDMYRTAMAILGNTEDAADVIQDTILTCWQKLETLREERYFKTWMTKILMNKCYDLKKQQISQIPLEECENLSSSSCDKSDDFNELLAQLDEKYRLPLVLFYGEGYKTAEIARILDIPKSTVQTRLARGREKLAMYLEERRND